MTTAGSFLGSVGTWAMEALETAYRGKSPERVATFATAKSLVKVDVGPPEPILPDENYLTIVAKKTVLAYDRILLESFYAVAHSTIVLLDGTGVPRTFTSFQTLNSDLLNLDKRAATKLVQGPHTLLDCVPFHGGVVEATFALLAVEAANYSKPLLSTLQKLSDIAGVSFFASASAVAEPLILGIQSLSQVGGGVQIAYTGNLPAHTGAFLIAAIDSVQFSWDRYTFAPDFSLLCDGVPVTDKSYMVITMEVSTERPTFRQIPELRSAELALNDAVTQAKGKIFDAGSQERKKVEDALANLQWQCLNTLELCSGDGERIAAKSRQKILRYMDMAESGLSNVRTDTAGVTRGKDGTRASDKTIGFSLDEIHPFPRPEV